MEKKIIEEEALRIKQNIIKNEFGIVENPGVVSEDDMDGEWEEFIPEDFKDKGESHE